MRLSLFKSMGGPCRVVMFGDSLTERAEWSELFPGVCVANRGIAGDTTGAMLARIDTVLGLRPERVFIMGGINDLIAGESVARILGRYQQLVELLRDGGISVVVQSTLHVSRPSLSRLNPLVDEINVGLQHTCAGNRCEFVDLNEVLAPTGALERGFTGDGVHLTGHGYVTWARRIAPLLRN